jgi:hypothetical protein
VLPKTYLEAVFTVAPGTKAPGAQARTVSTSTSKAKLTVRLLAGSQAVDAN